MKRHEIKSEIKRLEWTIGALSQRISDLEKIFETSNDSPRSAQVDSISLNLNNGYSVRYIRDSGLPF